MGRSPLTSFGQVKDYTRTDKGPSPGQLAKLAHSHLAGFALLALATSLLFAATRYRLPLAVPLYLAVFLGPMLDIVGWWLTHAAGMPWPYLVMAGGGLFGGGLMVMALLTLDEIWFRSTLGRLIGALSKQRFWT